MYKSEKQLEGGVNYNQPIHFQLVYQVLPALIQASTKHHRNCNSCRIVDKSLCKQDTVQRIVIANCVRRRRTLSIHVVSSRGIDHVPRVPIAMPVDFRVWTPSWTGTLSLDSIWTSTRSLDSMCDHCLLKNHTISLAFKTFSYTE